jgi:hypothetical protein
MVVIMFRRYCTFWITFVSAVVIITFLLGSADGFSIATTSNPQSDVRIERPNVQLMAMRRRCRHQQSLQSDQLQTSDMDSIRKRMSLISSFWLSVVIAGTCSTTNNIVHASEASTPPSTVVPTTILSGTVINPPSSSAITKSTSAAALYVTARPNTPDNVPVAILSGTRGKSPPVLAARFAQPTFPFTFDLVVPDNLTAEGAATVTAMATTTTTNGETNTQTPVAVDMSTVGVDSLWWSNDDLLVSVRWDQDGVASTRSPEDLVGRGLWKNKKRIDYAKSQLLSPPDDRLEIQLEGRGAFGKMVTGGK